MENADIINTHAHADHYGGNHLLKERMGSKIYAQEFEAVIMEHPVLEPVYLYGGEPIEEHKDKFFMARPSKPDVVIKEDKIEELDVLKLPGHSINLIGVATPDNVLFCSDAFFAEEVLGKYKIPYLFNAGKTLESLEMLNNTDYDYYLLSHGGLLGKEDAKRAMQKNIDKIKEINSVMTAFLKQENTIEGVLKYLSEKYDLYVNIGQYFLNLSIAKAYLSCLKAEGRIGCFVEEGQLWWKKT